MLRCGLLTDCDSGLLLVLSIENPAGERVTVIPKDLLLGGESVENAQSFSLPPEAGETGELRIFASLEALTAAGLPDKTENARILPAYGPDSGPSRLLRIDCPVFLYPSMFSPGNN